MYTVLIYYMIITLVVAVVYNVWEWLFIYLLCEMYWIQLQWSHPGF